MSYPNYPNYQSNPSNQQPPFHTYPQSYNLPYSPESGQNTSYMENAFSDKVIRLGFIRKVYSILCVQLSISFGTIFLFTFSPQVNSFAIHNTWLALVSFLATICIMIPMICVHSLRRRTPHNYILLGLFTIFESIFLGFFSTVSKPQVVLLAIFITAGIVLGLTLFAFQTKWDLTVCNGVMFAVLLCFSLSGFILMFFRHIPMVNLIYSTIGALIFSIYIVIDTQMIVGRPDRANKISSEEYIYASFILYMDIINLFVNILSILSNSDK